MKRSFLILIIFCVLLSACGDNSSSSSISTSTSPSISTAFTLLNREVDPYWKCIFDVEIQELISEDEIKSLAEYLHDTEGLECSPLFIYYFLPGDEPGQDMAWAYSHFNPGLEIGINGLDIESKTTLESINPTKDNNFIGSWIDTGVLPHKIIITKVGSSYEMKSIYSDGSSEIIALFAEVVNDEERLYKDPNNYYGDYMIIKENGNLAFFDNIGFIYELPPE